MTQPVDLVVDGAVLFNEAVGAGNVCLRLVVIVVGYEILHCIVREKLLEFGAKLRRQDLIVGKHQGGTVHLRNDVRHGEGLAGAGDSQQHLSLFPLVQTLHQLLNGFRLIPGRLIIRFEMKACLFHRFSF